MYFNGNKIFFHIEFLNLQIGLKFYDLLRKNRKKKGDVAILER